MSTFNYYNLSLSEKRSFWISKLKEHPEGIVIYYVDENYSHSYDHSHAVLLTDYQASEDTFYCADPAATVASGRITLGSSYIKTCLQNCGISQGSKSDQDYVIDNIKSSWWITSGIDYSKYSGDDPVDPPAAPSKVTVEWENQSAMRAKVSWPSVSGATYYDVEYDHGKDDWAEEQYSVRSNTDPVSIISVGVGGEGYRFRARACNSGGKSDWTVGTFESTHLHSLTHTAARAATCTEDGNIEYWYCFDCGKRFLDGAATKETDINGVILSSLGHNLAHVPAKAATEQTEGNIEYWYCSRCNTYFKDGSANLSMPKSLTVVPKLDHTHTLARVTAKAATCETAGNIEYWHCSSCGKYFSDAIASNEITQSQTVVAKLGHSLTHVATKAATETAEGNKEYWYCSRCGQYFLTSAAIEAVSKNETVIPRPVHQHTLTYIPAKAATCTENGNREYWRCTSCGDYFSDSNGINKTTVAAVTLEKLGHNYVDGVCTVCNAVQEDYYVDIHCEKQTIYFQGQFTDVAANQWFTNSVAEAFGLGLMKGNSADTFNPYGDVTLAEAITMACRIHSIYTNGTESFVQTGSKWYQVYLDYAYQNGIISRAYYNADVERKATRAQFAEIFAKALPDKALRPMNTIADNAIPDVSMSETYAPYVYKLYRAGILTGGDSMGTFSPGTFITRAEAAAIVSRMAESNNRKSFSLT